MDPSDLDEAYRFSAYGSSNLPFVVDGRRRGSHWLEGEADGDRRYVCDVALDGRLPDLLVVPRFSFSLPPPVPGPRARTRHHDFDASRAVYTRAADLPRKLVEDERVLETLLQPGAYLRLASSRGQDTRATWDVYVGSDALSRGFEGDEVREPGASRSPYAVPGRVDHVPSRVAARTASAIGAARRLVRGLDALASRGGDWSEVALFRAGALDDAALSRLMDAVLASSSWLSGHAARVGNGVEARLAMPHGQRELTAVMTVRKDGDGAAARLEAALPRADGATLTLSPERGVGGFLRSLREHEIGDPAIDRALLVEGDAARLDEVRAARGALSELLAARPLVALEPDRLVVDLPRAPFDDALPDVLTAALEIWDRIARQRTGQL